MAPSVPEDATIHHSFPVLPLNTTNGSELDLGWLDLGFSDGFDLGSSSMSHAFDNNDSNFNLFQLSTKTIRITLQRIMLPRYACFSCIFGFTSLAACIMHRIVAQCDVMNRVVVYILCFIKRSSYYVKVIFECMKLGADVRDVINFESA